MPPTDLIIYVLYANNLFMPKTKLVFFFWSANTCTFIQRWHTNGRAEEEIRGISCRMNPLMTKGRGATKAVRSASRRVYSTVYFPGGEAIARRRRGLLVICPWSDYLISNRSKDGLSKAIHAHPPLYYPLKRIFLSDHRDFLLYI